MRLPSYTGQFKRDVKLAKKRGKPAVSTKLTTQSNSRNATSKPYE